MSGSQEKLKIGNKSKRLKMKPFYWQHVLPSNKICSVELSTDKGNAICSIQCCTWGKHRFLILPSFPISLVDFFLQINDRIFSQYFRFVLRLSSRDSAVDSYFLWTSNRSVSSPTVESRTTPQSKLHRQQCITSEFFSIKDNTIDNL